nr:hypothetical protein Itr_chr02CG23480 [Ipomoea trifida]GMC49880.1 hypothetical protein Iba_chr01bCG11790 [Ipomoea batatas]GME17672.1 hypothetical protein Iba_scaffold19180CG0060 [Ipomoea batatas]
MKFIHFTEGGGESWNRRETLGWRRRNPVAKTKNQQRKESTSTEVPRTSLEILPAPSDEDDNRHHHWHAAQSTVAETKKTTAAGRTIATVGIPERIPSIGRDRLSGTGVGEREA